HRPPLGLDADSPDAARRGDAVRPSTRGIDQDRSLDAGAVSDRHAPPPRRELSANQPRAGRDRPTPATELPQVRSMERGDVDVGATRLEQRLDPAWPD